MRTKGASSFSEVTLEELNRVLKPTAKIPVARRFSEQLHLKGKGMVATTQNIIAMEELQFRVVDDLSKEDEEGEEDVVDFSEEQGEDTSLDKF